MQNAGEGMAAPAPRRRAFSWVGFILTSEEQMHVPSGQRHLVNSKNLAADSETTRHLQAVACFGLINQLAGPACFFCLVPLLFAQKPHYQLFDSC
jgi:hypothetical protein